MGGACRAARRRFSIPPQALWSLLAGPTGRRGRLAVATRRGGVRVFLDVEAVLFDMGGTLLDYPMPSWPVMAARCLEGAYAYLVRPESELAPPAAAMPDPAEAHARRARPATGAPIAHRAMMGLRRVVRSLSGRTLPRMAEACTRPLLAHGRPFDDALPVTLALKERGYRLGLVSNTPWGTPEYLWSKQLDRFGLAEHFAVRCFSSDIGFRKPDPRIFESALQRLGVRPERAGDDPAADIAGAARLAMRTVLLLRPGHRRLPGDAKPDLCVTTLHQLLAHLPPRCT